MDFEPASLPADMLRTFGFAVMRQFFDADFLADEIDRVMREGLPSQSATDYHGIRFQYVPMMTAETHVSLSLLDRAGARHQEDGAKPLYLERTGWSLTSHVAL